MQASAGAQDEINFEQGKTENFIKFETYCVKAFNYLRENSNQLINLFLIMLSAGMPELKTPKHIKHMQDKLLLQKSSREAEKEFKKQITIAMGTLMRRIDNLGHNYK